MARKIVVAEELAPAGLEALAAGFEVQDAAGLSRMVGRKRTGPARDTRTRDATRPRDP